MKTRCRVPAASRAAKATTLGPEEVNPGSQRLAAQDRQVLGPRKRAGLTAPSQGTTPALVSTKHPLLPDLVCQSIRSAPEARNQTFNDPSAGSPTETLLRLLLPLSATVWTSFRQLGSANRPASNPRSSLKHSIGSSDGRCVQRAGT